MEMERLKGIKEAEEKERRLKDTAIEGRQVIIEQMKERELKRLKEKEEQAREAQAMVRHMKELEDEARREAQKKKYRQKEMLDEIYDANTRAAEKKMLIKQQEIEEDEKIMKYAMDKAAKEAEYFAEQK